MKQENEIEEFKADLEFVLRYTSDQNMDALDTRNYIAYFLKLDY